MIIFLFKQGVSGSGKKLTADGHGEKGALPIITEKSGTPSEATEGSTPRNP